MQGTGLIAELVGALIAEERARQAVRAALREQGRLLHSLRAAGLPAGAVAHRVAAVRGIALPVRDRLRLAERLRKRAWRGTHRPVDLTGAHGQPSAADPRSDRAITPRREDPMAGKIVRKTTTTVEEFTEKADEEGQDEAEDDETEAEEADDHASRHRKKASRK